MAQAMTIPAARAAAAALQDIPDYRESVGARTGGLTLMLWGLVAAGIFLSYGTGAPWLEDRATWLLSLLWVPWVAAGIAMTATLWHSHAVAMQRQPTTRRDVLGSIAMTGLFLAIAGALAFALGRWAGDAWSTHATMAMANGVFAVAVGWAYARHERGAWPVFLAAAAAMLASGSAIGLSGMADPPAALLAALACGSSWFGAGAVSYLKG